MLHVTYILHVYMLNLALLTILSSILPSYRLSRVKICTIGIKVVLLFASYIYLQSSRHEDDPNKVLEVCLVLSICLT